MARSFWVSLILVACSARPEPLVRPELLAPSFDALAPDAVTTDTPLSDAPSPDATPPRADLHHPDTVETTAPDTLGDGFTPPDAELPSDAGELIIPPPPLDLTVRPGPGEVRAGRVRSPDELLDGPYTRGGVGDYKLYNSRVAFIIQDAGTTGVYRRYGGMPIDADVVRSEGAPGGSQLGDLFFGYNLRQFDARHVQVLSNGSDDDARIRVTGTDGDFPWLESFLAFLFPDRPMNLELTYDYVLGPDDDFLTIEVTVANPNAHHVAVRTHAVAFLMSTGLRAHFPGPGFDSRDHEGVFSWWSALGDRVTYGVWMQESELNMFMNYSDIMFGALIPFGLHPGESLPFFRYLFVTDRGLAHAESRLRELAAAPPLVALPGIVEADQEALRRGVRLHVVTSVGDHLTTARVGDDGAFELRLPPGSFELLAKADGYLPSPAVAVEIDGVEPTEPPAPVELILPSSTPFTLTVSDGAQYVPARISFIPVSGAPGNILPRIFGEERHPFGAALEIYSGTGVESGVIPRGEYRVWAMRGFEYERDMQVIEAADEPLELSFELERVVDTTGYLSTDTHVHGIHSPDSDVPDELRARTGLAEGLDVIMLTDHDGIFALSEALAAIPGGTDWAATVAGSEVTTYVYGHFNAFPLTPKPEELNQGFIDWFDADAPELFGRIRAAEPDPVVVMIAHPRSAPMAGYFNAVGLDIEEGTIKNPWNWSADFDAVEVFNGRCSGGRGEVVRDWFDLLNRGHLVSVGGGSDSHSTGRPVGLPRTYFGSSSTPRDFHPSELAAAFKELDVFISCGPFVRFEIGDARMGRLLVAPETLEAKVEIHAPSWMTLSDFRIIRNGEQEYRLPATEWPAAEGAICYSGTVALPLPDEDSWYVLEVRGSGNLRPLSSDEPYAITNPIFVDVDGDGLFNPPLPPYQGSQR